MRLIPHRKRSELDLLADKVAAAGLDALPAADRLLLRDRLAVHVLAQADGTAHPRALRWLAAWWANWREIAMVLVAVLGMWGLVRAVDRPERQVVAARDLGAFQVIGPGDIREETTEAPFGAYASTADVLGRFPLRFIPEGEPLLRDSLSRVRSPRSELEGRRIVSLAVPAYSATLAVPRTRVSLLLTPRDGSGDADASAILDDAIVLAVHDVGDTAYVVFALREGNVSTLSRLLGSSHVHILQQVGSSAR